MRLLVVCAEVCTGVCTNTLMAYLKNEASLFKALMVPWLRVYLVELLPASLIWSIADVAGTGVVFLAGGSRVAAKEANALTLAAYPRWGALAPFTALPNEVMFVAGFSGFASMLIWVAFTGLGVVRAREMYRGPMPKFTDASRMRFTRSAGIAMASFPLFALATWPMAALGFTFTPGNIPWLLLGMLDTFLIALLLQRRSP